MTVQAQHISKKYYRPTRAASHFEAVKPVDLSLAEGTLTAVMGRSGSGKSTLLYMLAGLLKPTTGTVLLDGTDWYAQNDAAASRFRNAHVGVIPQGQTGLYALTVLQNVLLPASVYGNTTAYEARAQTLLERMGIAHLASARMNVLSGGEMRRMAIARALIMQPALLFADEPTDDLDDENTAQVLSLLRSVADSGTSVFLVTHEPTASRYADVLYTMHAGELMR